MIRRSLMVLATSLVVFMLAACGEKPTVTVYKQGNYQGKPDNLPWQSSPFNSNKTEWEKTIKARNVGQNEYVRIEGQ